MREWTKRIEDAEWVPNPQDAERQARMLIGQIRDPAEFKREMFAAILLPLVKEFIAGAVSQMQLHKALKHVRGKMLRPLTTAEEFAIKYDIDLTDLFDYIEEFEAATRLPDWMIDEAMKALSNTIKRPYWNDISETFGKQAETLLQRGIEQGWSTAQIARELRNQTADPDDQWNITRAKAIARTETGNMSNSGASASIDKLNEETGLDLAKEWLSVLGSTTRPSHAAMHGQISDKDGMFDLSGYLVPWPSHPDLPPEERINCQCGILSTLMEEAAGEQTVGEQVFEEAMEE